MPNWCEGYFRVRGTKENVIKLFTETLKEVTLDPTTWEAKENIPEIRETEWSTIISLKDKERNYCFYMKGSNRHFIDKKEIEIYTDGLEEGEEFTFVTMIKGAWSINVEYIKELSEKFSVAIKVDAFELGVQFSQHIIFDCGKAIKVDAVEYGADNNKWNWECACPDFGG